MSNRIDGSTSDRSTKPRGACWSTLVTGGTTVDDGLAAAVAGGVAVARGAGGALPGAAQEASDASNTIAATRPARDTRTVYHLTLVARSGTGPQRTASRAFLDQEEVVGEQAVRLL